MESFIEHQDACNVGRARSTELHGAQPPACLSRTASSPSQSLDTNFSAVTWPAMRPASNLLISGDRCLELQLLPSGVQPYTYSPSPITPNSDEAQATKLRLSIGSSPRPDEEERVKEEEMRAAAAEKAFADEARRKARRQVEEAEQEFANAKRIRQHAQAELDKAQLLKEQATRRINALLLQMTCLACRQHLQTSTAAAVADRIEVAASRTDVISYRSSAVAEGDGETMKRRGGGMG